MPKCPRCQKEVYFGKGFLLPPPRGPHSAGTAGLSGCSCWGAPMLHPAEVWVPGTPQCLQVPVHPSNANSWGASKLCTPVLWVPRAAWVGDPVNAPKEVSRCRVWAAAGTPTLQPGPRHSKRGAGAQPCASLEPKGLAGAARCTRTHVPR